MCIRITLEDNRDYSSTVVAKLEQGLVEHELDGSFARSCFEVYFPVAGITLKTIELTEDQLQRSASCRAPGHPRVVMLDSFPNISCITDIQETVLTTE